MNSKLGIITLMALFLPLQMMYAIGLYDLRCEMLHQP